MAIKNQVIVVGGGVAGILSALLLAEKEYSVYLIEKQNSIGGLLRSIKTDYGYFDYGTHMLRETGIQELDKILYDEVSIANNWHILEYPKAGNYFKTLNEDNGFVNLKDLGDDYYKAVIGLLSAKNIVDKKASNLIEQLTPIYGSAIVDLVYKPILEKFFKTPVESLATDAHLLFSLSRFIGFDKEITNLLKSIPLFDNKFAFTSFSEGLSSKRSFYPLQGGVGAWIDRLEKKLNELNVNIITSNAVQSIEKNNQKIESVILENGQAISCNHLIWTIPAFFLLKAATININRSFAPPKRLRTYLFNFTIDTKYCTDIHYLECFEPNFSTFRATFYDNLVQHYKNQYRISVEVLSDKKEEVKVLSGKVFKELIKMGVINQKSKMLFQNEQMISAGFPVPTQSFREAVNYQNSLVKDNFSNVFLLGRGSGKKFFMNDVLVNVFDTIKESF